MSDQKQTEEAYCQEKVRPYREQVRNTPGLLSLLYDIDLLPEQIVKSYNIGRMVAVCELWKLAEVSGDNVIERLNEAAARVVRA